MLMSGVMLADYEAVLASDPAPGPEWSAAWCRTAQRHIDEAAEAATRGHRLTAAQSRIVAAANMHWAQFLCYDDVAAKASMLRAQDELLAAAVTDLPGVEEVILDGDRRVGWLIRPRSAAPHPLLILLPGLDGAKEELYGWSPPILDRGWAVVVLDSPGVGAYSDVAMSREAVGRVVGSVVDLLASHPLVDSERIAIAGFSLGGQMALLALGCTPRLKAGASIGAPFDTEPRVARMNESGLRGFLHVTHTADAPSLRPAVADWTAQDLGRTLTAPVLIVHSDDDPIIGLDHASRYAAEIDGATLRIVSGAGQSCYREGMAVLGSLGDWLNDVLPDTRSVRPLDQEG
jgi:2,6-dihydroxypseudooxynicotine hydrolase